MTKNIKAATQTPANNDSPLKAKIADVITDESFQLGYARKLLGEKATEVAVRAEAERRLEVAHKLAAQLEKPLGTSERPYPMWGSQRVEYNGQSNIEQVLSVIADDNNPLKIYSERPYKEVIAMAFCDMPVPSMLPLFFDGLERRRPESTNRTQMMIGDPGAGKSFMGGMQGRLRSKGSVEVFDCGGKNMNELLFEMVLDFGAGDALPVALDKRLKAGSLQDISIGLLKSLPGGIISLDADKNIQSIDWSPLKNGGLSPEDVAAAHEILMKVRNEEGLDKGGGNALGMNSQYGPLVKAFIEGREIVLDEYNKSKEGTDNALQTVWQFMNGEINSCTVENPLKNKDASAGPSSFTFKRDDMQVGFFVTLTGNKTEDGLTTRSLNKSVYSRLSPQTLPDPTVADWQHRICQMMVGLPVSTLYSAFREQADANPKEFGDWLMSLRKEKAAIEGVPVPELQETLLQNWQNVKNASEKLANFYNAWAGMTDAEDLLKTGNTDLIEEVDEEYSKKEGIDFRKIKQFFEEATPIRPHMQSAEAAVGADFKNFFKPPVLPEKEYENPSVGFGTRLVDFLDRMVFEKTEAVGKEKLYQKLQTAMDNFGLRDVMLSEGAHSGQKSVEADLNISVFDSNDLGKQAKAARKTFCDYLRQVDPEILEKDDDKIITTDRLRKALQVVKNNDTAETKELFVVNRDHETLGEFPLTGARIEDAATYPADKTEADFTYEDMVSHDDFLASLALPTVSAKNLSAIWDSNVREQIAAIQAANQNDQTVAPPEEAAGPDEALDMAENVSPLGLATTTLRVLFKDAKGDERDVSVHVVLNSNRNKSLVVGEAVPSKLRSAFKEAGITYVDRNDPNARSKVEEALNKLTRGMPEDVQGKLADAFKFRNDVEKGNTKPLAALLVDDSIDMMLGKYLIKSKSKKLSM